MLPIDTSPCPASTHIVIVSKYHTDYNDLIEYNNHYDYPLNPGYSCVYVSSETFCLISLKYRLSSHPKYQQHFTSNLPTYAIVFERFSNVRK